MQYAPMNMSASSAAKQYREITIITVLTDNNLIIQPYIFNYQYLIQSWHAHQSSFSVLCQLYRIHMRDGITYKKITKQSQLRKCIFSSEVFLAIPVISAKDPYYPNRTASECVSNEVTNGKCQSGTLIKGNQKCQSIQSYNQSSYQLLFDDLTSTRNGDAESFLLQNHSWQSSYRIFRPYSKRDEVITKYFLQRS